MRYSDMMRDSSELHPSGGFRMSPAACGFILAEMEGLVEKYQKELKEGSDNPVLRRMVEHHLEGLEYLTEEIRKGMNNKPE